MKRLSILLLAAAAAATATGCSSPNKQPPTFAWDKTASFAGVKTFAWHDGPPFQFPRGGSIVDGRFVDEHVRRDVEAELARKGYRKVEGATPDIYVTYLTGAGGIVDHDVWGHYGWWSPYQVYMGSNVEKEGSLALDIRDATKKLLWRGVIVRVVGKNPEDFAETIDRAVRDLLKNFPPTS